MQGRVAVHSPEESKELSVTFHSPGDGKEPSAPEMPLVLDPSLEGYNEERALDYMDSLFKKYLNVRQNRNKEKDLTFLSQREAVMVKKEFKEDHPILARGGDVLCLFSTFQDEAALVFNVLVGGKLIDEGRKKSDVLDPSYLKLLEFYVGARLAQSAFLSTSNTYLKYSGVKRKIKEELDKKGIMKAKDFQQLDGSVAVNLENLANAASIALIVYGSTFLTRSGEFNRGLAYIIAGCVDQSLASAINHLSKLRFAEELLGASLDGGIVPQTPAYRKALWGGVVVGFSGAIMLGASSDRNSALSYAGFFALATGMLSTLSLGPRLRGSDYIDFAITKREIGDSTLRLQSRLLNCRPSRSDVDDFLSAGLVVSTMGVVANVMDREDDYGFLTVAGCALAIYFQAKVLFHTVARSKAQELLFWHTAQAPKVAVIPEPSRAEQKENNCYLKTKGCLSRVAGELYRWMTKTPKCCPAQEVKSTVAARP